jgi:cation diffusion facilitator family transporter
MGGSHGIAAVAGPQGTKEGLRALRISGVMLGAAAAAQLFVVLIGGSVGLLAAALDNIADLFSTIVLSVAFLASRRAADRRYTFGYQRLEDLGGIFVVLMIWSGVGIAGWQSYRKLTGDHSVDALAIGIAVAAIGALANEAVARYKIRVGRKIGSEPLIADGKHARTDSLASVAALIGLVGVSAGFEQADPLAGLAITLAIAYIAIDASRHVLARVLDAVDPAIVDTIVHAAGHVEGVSSVGRVQARWAGRSLYVSITVAADGAMSLSAAHDVAEAVHHQIIHDLPGVAQVDVHVDPGEPHGADAHSGTADHPAVEQQPGHGHAH